MNTVHDIMTAFVCSVDKNAVLAEVEGLFVTNDISGAPVVDEYGKVVGFISKSDLNHLSFVGGDPNETQVWEVASFKIITIDESATIKQAAQLMVSEHVHHLIVTDGQNMVGLLSAFDLVQLIAEQY